MTRRPGYAIIGLLCIAAAIWLFDHVRTLHLAPHSNVTVATSTAASEHFERLAIGGYAESLNKQQVIAMLGSPDWQGQNSLGQEAATWESTFGLPPLHDRRYRFEATFSNEGRVYCSSALVTNSEGGWQELKADANGRLAN